MAIKVIDYRPWLTQILAYTGTDPFKRSVLVDDDNPTFVTVTHILGSYHVDLMEWDKRADSYQVTQSIQKHDKAEANQYAREWAARDGLEVR